MADKNISKTTTDSDIRIHYFQALDIGESKKTGYVCMAMLRPPRGDCEREYSCAFSFCSPHEEFSKKVAREMAIGRLSKNNHTITFNYEASNLNEVFGHGLCLVAQSEDCAVNVPGWLKKANKNFKIKFGLSSKDYQNYKN